VQLACPACRSALTTSWQGGDGVLFTEGYERSLSGQLNWSGAAQPHRSTPKEAGLQLVAHTASQRLPSPKRPGRCRRRCGSATSFAIVEPQATTKRKEGPGVGPGLLKRRGGKHAKVRGVGSQLYGSRRSRAKCQERISECRRLRGKSFVTCDSTYLAKRLDHA
jgi:hypothetical protein